jgi:hypothetical protein
MSKNNNVVKTDANGYKSWEHKDGDKYIVTGRVHNSHKTFRLVYSSWANANSINLWNGRVWLVREGKRYLVKTVTN